MRLTAYHDSEGTIIGLALSPADDATPAEVVSTVEPDVRRTEVRVPQGVTFDFNNPQRVYEELEKLRENYRVDKNALATKS
jgi:hypothetical protein